jgi:disulfide bond formation protein DsbB
MAVMRKRDRLAVLLFAIAVVAAIVGVAFALGYILGKVLI